MITTAPRFVDRGHRYSGLCRDWLAMTSPPYVWDLIGQSAGHGVNAPKFQVRRPCDPQISGWDVGAVTNFSIFRW